MAALGNTTITGTLGLSQDAAAADQAVRKSQVEAMLAGMQSQHGVLTAIAGVTTAADKLVYFTGLNAAATTTLTAFARTLLDDANAVTARATLGLTIGTDVQAAHAVLSALAGVATGADKIAYFTGGNAASATTLTAFARTLLDDADATTARATLGLSIGSQVQGFSEVLGVIAGVNAAPDTMVYFVGANEAAATALTPYARTLLDDASASAARTTLGLAIGTNVQAYHAALAAIAGNAGTVNLSGTTLTLPGSLTQGLTISNTVDTLTVRVTTANGGALSAICAIDTASAIFRVAKEDGATSIFEVTGYAATFYFPVTVVAELQATEFTGGGAGLTDLDADQLTTGTVPSARLETKLGAIADLAVAADKLLYFTGASTVAIATFTPFARTLMDDADAAAARATLGIGPAGLTLVVDGATGNDGTGARGRWDLPYLTPSAARAAALSGDTIFVRPGNYTTAANLAKNGVNWYFSPGATVTLTDAEPVAAKTIWDDGGAAMVFAVAGAGTFKRILTTNNDGVGGNACVRCSHVSSVIDIECLDMAISDPGQSALAIDGVNGRLRVRCRDVTATGPSAHAVWWSNGVLSVEGRKAYGEATGVYSVVDGAPTGDAHVRFEEIVGGTDGAVYEYGTNAAAAIWIRANIVKGVTGPAVTAQGSNRVYVETQKFFGVIHHNQITGTPGLLYVRGDKVSSANGLFSGQGGTSFIDIAHWDITGGVSTISVSGGTHTLANGEMIGSTGSTGMQISGGVTKLRQMRVSTVANAASNPIIKSGGALSLDAGCVLLAEGTRNSIEAATAQTVISTGAWANTAKHANVTITGTLNVAAGI